MKIKDIVYVVDDDKITKTRIVGIQDKLEREEFGSEKQVIKRYYALKGEKDHNDGWISKDELYTTLDAAQKIISDVIQKEAIERISNINLVDYSGEV